MTNNHPGSQLLRSRSSWKSWCGPICREKWSCCFLQLWVGHIIILVIGHLAAFSSASLYKLLPRLNTSGMSNNYNGGGTNSSTWGPSSTGTNWLGKSMNVLPVLSSLPVPDSGGSGSGTTYGGGNSGGGGLGGLGGTSGPPSFNQGSTFIGGSSYGPSFAGDIIRKPSR